MGGGGGRSGGLDRLDEIVVPLEESSLDEEEDVFSLKDSSGRFVSARLLIYFYFFLTCSFSDDIDVLKSL